MSQDTEPLHRHRIFTVGELAFDEATRTLSVAGETIAIQRRPLDVLLVLLDRAPGVVTAADIMDAVWRGRIVEESSLTTAIRSLRAALGPAHRGLIENVHGYGYRIAATPLVAFAAHAAAEPLSLRAGERAPGHGAWRLVRALGDAEPQDVWLARHDKSGAERVFKYAGNAARLDALKREAALSRVLRQTLGERPEFVPVLAWHLAEPPFFIEQAFGGEALSAWAEAQGGVGAVPLARRLDLFARIARAIADAHGAGVLHGDIKPGNVLVAAGPPPAVRLIDFGAGGLTAAASRAALSQSMRLAADVPARHRTGTWLYAAPEILRGVAPSVKADIYALGILLFQLVTGDFAQPLSAGWDALVADPDLRAAIAAAAAGDPARRPDSAARLAEVVTRLGELRAERAARDAADRQAAALAEQVRRAEIRRPWRIAAAACLALGAIGTGAAAWRAVRERDEALRQTRIAKEVNLFLTQDLLGRGNPANSGKPDETLMEAAAKAQPRIGQRFADEPVVAGSTYAALATAYEARSAYPQARSAYEQAIDAFARAEGTGSADAVILRLRLAYMELSTIEKGSAARAAALISVAKRRIDTLGPRADEARAWLEISLALADVPDGNFAGALNHVDQAIARAEQSPGGFSREQILPFKLMRARTLMRLRRFSDADVEFRHVRGAWTELRGPQDPNALHCELELAQSELLQGQREEAVELLKSLVPELQSVFGVHNQVVLHALGVRLTALTMLGRYDESIGDARTLYHAAVDMQGERSAYAIASLADIAEIECRGRKINDGVRDAGRSLALAIDAFNASDPIAHAVRSTLSICLVAAGRYDDAEKLLEKIDQKKVAQYLSDLDDLMAFDLMHAEIELSRGHTDAARSYLARPLKVFDKSGGDPYFHEWAHTLAGKLLPAAQSTEARATQRQ